MRPLTPPPPSAAVPSAAARRSDDAAYAYRKAEGTKMDGRTWRVDWARRGDFDFFGWPWKEEGGEGGRSPSRSPSQGARMDA